VTRLCIILITLAVIARTRVAVLPGWVVPLPVVLLAAVIAVCAAVVAWIAWMVLRSLRTWTTPVPAAEAAS
jgi:hypothetical protein